MQTVKENRNLFMRGWPGHLFPYLSALFIRDLWKKDAHIVVAGFHSSTHQLRATSCWRKCGVLCSVSWFRLFDGELLRVRPLEPYHIIEGIGRHRDMNSVTDRFISHRRESREHNAINRGMVFKPSQNRFDSGED